MLFQSTLKNTRNRSVVAILHFAWFGFLACFTSSVYAEKELSHTLTSLKGDAVVVSDLVGKKPIYLKFWASWCKPCMKEMPHLQHSYEEYSEDIHILAVNIDLNETDQDIQNVVERYGLTLPIYKDDEGQLARALNFVGTPYHVLLDTDGDVVHQGHTADADLDRKMSLIAKQSAGQLPVIELSDDSGQSLSISDYSDKQILYFTATWCDWYLRDSRPNVAKDCIDGQKRINDLSLEHKELGWRVLTSHLWTGNKDISDYIDKFKVQQPVYVDVKGDAFFTFKVKSMPTLILLHKGKVWARSKDVNQFDNLVQRFVQL